VVLGAGFDCRLYRLPQVSSVAAFEVDRPSTFATKVSLLRSLLPKWPSNVRFVKIDFDRQSLAEPLEREGFDTRRSAIFVWEGVTNYLTADAVDSVIRYVAGCTPGSRMVFTYVHRGALDGSGLFPDAAKILSNVARLGEPWTFGFYPEQLPSYLHKRGLQLSRDDDSRAYRSAYFGKAAEFMNGYNFYHVAVARFWQNLPQLAPCTWFHLWILESEDYGSVPQDAAMPRRSVLAGLQAFESAANWTTNPAKA
jgi:methyltransferase (TIGR00027 family)